MNRNIISVSGGKDSTAMLLWAIEQGFEFEAVTMDTGWEAPQTYDYLNLLRHNLGVEIKELEAPRQMVELIDWKMMFPSRRFRYCTQYLKVFPFLEYVGENDEVTNYVGIRAAESKARSLLPERDQMEGADHVEVVRPLLNWSRDDVVAMHRRHGLPPNPLYLLGVERVGCWPCVFERKSDIRIIAKNDPARIDTIREMESRVQLAKVARMVAKGDTYESLGHKPPTFFSLKKGKGEDRKSTHVAIDDVVTWSRTAHGGRQLMLDHGDERRGCLRWGMCDV